MITGIWSRWGSLCFLGLFLIYGPIGAAAEAATNHHGVVVLIGNKSYFGDIPEVSYAHNDADVFKRFVIDVLGFRDGNIIDLRDATKARMEAVFGNRQTAQGKLHNWVRPDKSDVFVFYSGHGVPGLKDRRAYLLPIDGDPNLAEITGYGLDVLYKNLALLPARSVTVFLDACFSGDSPKGLLIAKASGISIAADPLSAPGKLTVVTASQGDQLTSWDDDARLGQFSKHMIDALYGVADGSDFGNGDGEVTLGETMTFLEDEMSYQARRRFGRVQRANADGVDATVLASIVPGRKPPTAPPPATEAPAAKAPAKATKTAAVDPQAGVASLDGSWVPDKDLTSDNTCPAGEFIFEEFIVKDGKVSGSVGHSRDGPFRFSTTVKPGGLVSLYSSGQYVMIQAKGKLTADRAKGTFKVSGEVDCGGSWELVRKK